MSSPRRVHLVFKNHVDFGFTASTTKIVHDQINWMLPTAVSQARQLRDAGDAVRFCWTLPSWLVWTAFERSEGIRPDALEAAIGAGDLAWHAMPFTTHTEAMDAELLEFGLSLSQRLDARCGTRTCAAKLTDVPGHTLGLVGALADAGVQFLHVGVNYMSACPNVPRHFRWRDAAGREVVVFYDSSYAATHAPAGTPDALAFLMVGDNMEVPSLPDIHQAHADLAREFPGATIRAGSLSDFARTLTPEFRASLPVVDQEIGDSWIHGLGSDPWKLARYRSLLRLRKEWLRAGRLLRGTPTYHHFSEPLALLAEHTWGASIGATFKDTTNWVNADFARVRHRGNYRVVEATWQEQRDYLEDAVLALPDEALRAEATAAMASCRPLRPDLTGTRRLEPASGTTTVGDWSLVWSPTDGGLNSLRDAQGREWVLPGGALGVLTYRTYSAADFARFQEQYSNAQVRSHATDFLKVGLQPRMAVSQAWQPSLLEAWRSGDGQALHLRLGFAVEAHRDYGAPGDVWLSLIAGPKGSGRLDWDLGIFDKTETRLPEALWMHFQPAAPDGGRPWLMDKLGVGIDPRTVVSRGGRGLHAVGDGGVTVPLADGSRLRLTSLDAALVSPGRPQLVEFADELPDLAGGWHFNLCNNQWGTNFPLWCGGDLRFRFRLQIG